MLLMCSLVALCIGSYLFVMYRNSYDSTCKKFKKDKSKIELEKEIRVKVHTAGKHTNQSQQNWFAVNRMP